MAELPVYMGPLRITALEQPLPMNVSDEPGDVALLFLGDLVADRSDPLGVMRKRYEEASRETEEPRFAPEHDVIMRHVIEPLKEAKQCYVLGMPVACIAQAGLVGEMVALWRFRMLQPLDEEQEKLLQGRDFDRLRQEERVRVLRALETMDEGTIAAFGELRALRRQYMHFMVDKKKGEDADARRALRYANALVVKTLDFSFKEGMVILPPKLEKFIREIISLEEGEDLDPQRATMTVPAAGEEKGSVTEKVASGLASWFCRLLPRLAVRLPGLRRWAGCCAGHRAGIRPGE